MDMDLGTKMTIGRSFEKEEVGKIFYRYRRTTLLVIRRVRGQQVEGDKQHCFLHQEERGYQWSQ